MATLENLVRPFAIPNNQAQPQRLLRSARYAPNLVLKIGRNSGSGKTGQWGSSNSVTFYRDIHQEENRQD